MAEDLKVRFIPLDVLLEKSPIELLGEIPDDLGDDFMQALTDQIDPENDLKEIIPGEKRYIWLIVKIGEYCSNYIELIEEAESEEDKADLAELHDDLVEKQTALHDSLQSSMQIRLREELDGYIHCYPASNGRIYGCRGLCTFCEEDHKMEGRPLQ